LKLSPLTYAYIGDAVYELYIRKRLIDEHPQWNPHFYFLKSIEYVKASNQAKALRQLWDNLDDEEKQIVKMGRNAKPKTIPKNATVSDYKFATAFECLIGFLYINNSFQRLDDILQKTYEILNKKGDDK